MLMNSYFRVLLIEDDEDDHALVKELLQDAGSSRFHLDWVDSFELGLDAICRAEHNVVLLDYRLGARNGLDLLREATQKGCTTPIILLTGQGGYDIDLQAMKAGAADYMAKDQLNSDLLERTIRYAVERKTAELELISYRDHLEDLVRERTAQLEERTRELERVNEKLHLEIVEREKTEEALRESEGKYRNLIDSSLDIVYTVRADGTISSLNPAFESVTGWSSTEWLGKGFSSLIHPEDLSVIQERLEGILRGERRVGYEARILTRSGEYRILELKTVPLVRKGGVVGALGTARDVTARRLAENETNKQKEFLGNVLESLSYPFYVFDANDYTIQMANSAAAPFGLHPNITCHTLPHGEFGSCTRAEHICSLEKIKQTGQPLITEHLHYDREGKPKYLEVHGYPIVDSNGKVAQIIEYSLDVSERRKVEEELRRTRDDLAREKSLLDAVLNQMPSGIIVAEPGGGIILSNQQASEILEHPRKHLSHRDEYSEYRALHPDGRPYEPGEYLLTRALHRGEIIIDEEVQIVLPSSGTKTVLASASPVKDIDGKVVAAVVTFQDISDRKRAEAELHRREQEYRALVENSPDVVMRVDRNLRRIFANRALETVTGYPVSHFVGSSIYEPEREDRKEYIALMERACRRVLSTGEEEAFEFPYPTTKGTRYFYMRIVPEYSKNNQIESLLTISRDVTDLRQVQEELRRARDELELRVRERTSELGEANKALKLDEARLEALWKLSQMDEVSNRDVADFTLKQQIRLTRSKNGAIGFMNDEGSVFTLYSCTAGFLDSGMVGEKPVSFPIESVPLLAEVVRNQQPIVAGNLDVSSLGAICPRISDGFHRFMCVPAMEGDRVLAVAIVANKDEEYDSSDIRQVTLLLDGMGKLVRRREAVKALRQAETLAAMGRALSAVAHDVKTPLVAIGGFTRIVHGHLDQSSADRAKLDIVINEVRRLEGLLENILDFSRPLKLDKSLQDVSSIILESLTVMEDLAQQRDLKIETGLADLPRVYIDPMRMKQVIINLVMNALQASPPGNTVTVTTQLRGKRLLIDVKDQGNGVPSNKREEIFAPFFSTKKEGTGLGLPISKKIIEAHNGSIHVLDNAGKGATFRLMFPALTGNHDAQKGEAP